MGAPDYELRNCVRRGEMAKIKELIKNGADYTVSGETLRAWTPLHIACWGSQKPQVDKEVVEQILLQAKKDGKTNDIITAKDKLDGKTPIELAKERQAELLAIAAAASAAGDGEEKNELDEKRKYDQIVQMLEKGVDAA
mmetsp:Transcript_12746/g.41687  ORF Transcript_12746/g.41687 Transcript_12746/m.41687 type:complete len:139 (+) Transcript_12746:40-456(+)